jgi:hypothetical protein
LTSRTYSSISLQWKPGFDGGWPQAFWVSLDERPWKQTNHTYFKFTRLCFRNESSNSILSILELEHVHHYNVSVRAFNRLGQSVTQASLRVRTDDVPIRKEGTLRRSLYLSLCVRLEIHSLLDIPIIEHAAVHLSDKTINYRLNNASFAASKAPLCLRLEIHNQSNLCPRIVTPSGFFKLDDYEVQHIHNVSLCLDQYDGYCGKSVPVATSKHPLCSDHEMNFVA